MAELAKLDIDLPDWSRLPTYVGLVKKLSALRAAKFSLPRLDQALDSGEGLQKALGPFMAALEASRGTGPALNVFEVEVATGKEVASREVKMDLGKVVRASTSVDSDSKRMLVNFLIESPGRGGVQSSILLAPDLRVRWVREFEDELGGEARFDASGNVILRDGKKVHVGTFEN